MTLKLGKVNRGPHLPTLVASSISREISQGRLKPGDQLPTEQALAKTFGVSRNVVREAIARLRSEDRIWSQQGRGAFVADSPNAKVLTIDNDTLQRGNSFASLFELRGILEVQAAALAAKRRSKGDLVKMRNALKAMAATPYGSVEWLKADLEFHSAVAHATSNPYISQFLGFVSEKVRESILAAGGSHHSDEMAGATLAEHEAILATIQAGDAEGANGAMRTHLDNAAQRVGLPVNGNDERARPTRVNTIARLPSRSSARIGKKKALQGLGQ
jgi:GntR family transcriptional regulator, transcriptional repressor for pyruvate dehydrogenase complex